MKENLTPRQIEIVEAAGKLLTHVGVTGLTIKNLAHEMKFSESAVYRHFSSKEELIVQMLRYLRQCLEEQFINSLEEFASPIANFNTLFEKQFAFFEANRHFAVVVFSDGLMETSHDINEGLLQIMELKTQYLSRIIEEGQRQYCFSDALKSYEWVHMVLGAVRLLMYKWRVAHFQFGLQEKGMELCQTIQKLMRTTG